MDELLEQAVYDAACRRDRRPLQASQLRCASRCAASAAVSFESDAYHLAHTLDCGPLWRISIVQEEDEQEEAVEFRAADGCLVDQRLVLQLDGQVVDLEREHPVSPIVIGRAPYMWSHPSRLVRDGLRWTCPANSNLCLAGRMDMKGLPVFPRDFEELFALVPMAKRWTGATGPVDVTVHSNDEQLTIQFDELTTDELAARLRGAVARVELQRQAQARGQPLCYWPGLHCSECELHQTCDSWTAAARSIALSLPSGKVEPEQLVIAHEWLTMTISQTKTLLRRLVHKSGPIKLSNGTSWGATQRKSRSWPAAEVARTLDMFATRPLADSVVRVPPTTVEERLRAESSDGVITLQEAMRLSSLIAHRMTDLGVEQVKTSNSYGFIVEQPSTTKGDEDGER